MRVSREAPETLDVPEAMRGAVVPVVDFGSQYGQLIARRVRDAGVYSVLVPPDTAVETLAAVEPCGLILSGGPGSVYASGAPGCDGRLFELGVPVLGICYGMQVACQLLGAAVEPAAAREYGRTRLERLGDHPLLAGVPEATTVWMSHGDQVQTLPEGFEPLAATESCPFAAVRHAREPFYGVQFHPEVSHTPEGGVLLRNFLFNVCGAPARWRMADFVGAAAERIRAQVGEARVVCGLSGGVDSAVAAALVAEAVGEKLTCIFVDNGLLRAGERDLVESAFRGHFSAELRVIDATDEFLADLKGVTDPQEKRRRIGTRFIDVFRRASADLADARFLAQGTLYPDVVESGHGLGRGAANIKLHHNVGGLPEELGFDLVEPLRHLFKDEVRRLGEVLGLPEDILWRHPFPGPGLAVRILGEVTPARLELLRACDLILLEEIERAGLYRETAQVFAVLLPVQSVGVMGDDRSYESVIAVRAVESQDFMTADWARLPHEVLATISTRMINEVRGVNRVVYDVSSKPPATIEWE